MIDNALILKDSINKLSQKIEDNASNEFLIFNIISFSNSFYFNFFFQESINMLSMKIKNNESMFFFKYITVKTKFWLISETFKRFFFKMNTLKIKRLTGLF